MEHCERVQIIAASKRICIANCRECTFYLGVNNQPLIVGDNHKLQVSSFFFPAIGDMYNIPACYKVIMDTWKKYTSSMEI